MQTFMPYPDYWRSLHCLDLIRLRNQTCRETITLLRGGWANHPASRMWKGHFHDLAIYGITGLGALNARTGANYPDTLEELLKFCVEFPNTGPPEWMGNEEFHASHRSNLLRKDSVYYGQYGWTEPPDLPYIWPCISRPTSKPAEPLPTGRRSR
jgi:hypothetical protein